MLDKIIDSIFASYLYFFIPPIVFQECVTFKTFLVTKGVFKCYVSGKDSYKKQIKHTNTDYRFFNGQDGYVLVPRLPWHFAGAWREKGRLIPQLHAHRTRDEARNVTCACVHVFHDKIKWFSKLVMKRNTILTLLYENEPIEYGV